MAAEPDTSSFFYEKLKEARQLGCTPADDHEPYKHRYAAADLLKELADQVLTQTQEQEQEQEQQQRQLLRAWCKLERGLQLLETDLLTEGQKVLEDALAYAWPNTVEALAMQLQAHNALAALWCERSENETALSHLQSADTLYSRITQLQGDSPAGSAQQPTTQQQPAQDHAAVAAPSSSAPTSSSSSWQAGLVDSDQVERDRTTTLFYKAQLYGLMGDRMQSASYCAATLNRQLNQGDLDVNEWVQNCLQLSGCFLDCNTFALSQHCCAAVEALLLQQHELQLQGQARGQQEASDASCTTQDKDTASQQQEQQQQQQEPGKHSAVPSGSTNKDQTDGKDQAAKQQQQQKDAASKGPLSSQEQQDSEEDAAVPGGPSPALVAALALLESDVAANVCLAFAKLRLYTLVASHEVVLEGKQVKAAFSSAQEVPAVLCFDALPPLSSLDWGSDAYAHTYDQALPLFKAALPWFRRALGHYQLDGWVTEHVNTLFEMSNLYRCLAGFEADPHKRCVMHHARTKLLAPLEGQLSPTHYPGLSRSISLELGNTFREIADIKAAAGREPEKVAAAMQSAAGHYRLFLDSFRVEGSGSLPDRVEPEMEQHYLSGMFSMARMLQGLPGTGTLLPGRPCGAGGAEGDARSGAAGQQDKARQQELEMLEQATGLLGSLVKYVRTNEVAGWAEQADMADELAGLLQEKVKLVRSVAQLGGSDGGVVC